MLSRIQDEKSNNVHFIRGQMETILLGQPIKGFGNIESYLAKVREIDAEIAGKIDGMFRYRQPMS